MRWGLHAEIVEEIVKQILKGMHRHHSANTVTRLVFWVHMDLHKRLMHNVRNYHGSVWPREKSLLDQFCELIHFLF